ncbi:immunoglobulin alpha-2 heavy chain-like, partial [Tachysurus fulvidraco]|uniref:immunoglobulin alpha-2 heavy chain-like n=1 Tax=Tachysurus fulvidraco TaxID=1234273 RepID=UPI001FEEF492
MFLPVLLLLAASSYVECAVELTQDTSVMLKPGDSLILSCKVSGYSLTDNSYATAWIRQPAGKTLEWINHIWGGGSIGYKESLKSKFSVSKDASSSTVTLRGQNMQTEDTAVYYCARVTHSDTTSCSAAMFSTSLLLLLAAASYVHGEELTQPASMTVQPGQSLSIQCKVSYSLTSYGTAFIRQPAGKALEWVTLMGYDGKTYYSEKLKSRFQVTRDTSSSTVTLTGQNMQTEDTAVYYCA